MREDKGRESRGREEEEEEALMVKGRGGKSARGENGEMLR
jgi:hypothetical protein